VPKCLPESDPASAKMSEQYRYARALFQVRELIDDPVANGLRIKEVTRLDSMQFLDLKYVCIAGI
jgi:hypothetical protein